MEYLALIPARGGSKGIPGKNLKLLAGKPLIAWTIEAAKASKKISLVVVTTDCPEIAKVSRCYGAEVPFLRPPELATDEAPTEPALIHAVNFFKAEEVEPDAIVLLQPTSPLRFPGTIDDAIQKFETSKADSLLGVVKSHSFHWKLPNGDDKKPIADYDFVNRPRRQDIRPEDIPYRETGSIYITKTGVLLSTGNRLAGNISLFIMRQLEGYEIDTPVDFTVLESLLRSVSDASDY